MEAVNLEWTTEKWKRDVLRNNETAVAVVQVCEVDNIMDLLREFVGNGWFDSNGEARRLLDQGAVELNGEKLKFNDEIKLSVGDKIKMGNMWFAISKLKDK